MNKKENIKLLDYSTLLKPLEELHACRICPRNCNADRFSDKLGYCKAGAGFSISSICIHNGEEPVISGDKGICNIFFTNNYSRYNMELPEVLEQICTILDKGINIVGFVSPSHFVPQVKVIVNSLRALGYAPVFVYNTNGYDLPEIIRSLENYIDVYLPDIKYSDRQIARDYSDSKDYPEIALNSLKEMYRQKGGKLIIGDDGYAKSGIIIRHLVLPGSVENSAEVLRSIAQETSNELHISLMSQYYPTEKVAGHRFLGRSLRVKEYNKVLDTLDELGFENGWVQELESQDHYRPDFDRGHPFEE